MYPGQLQRLRDQRRGGEGRRRREWGCNRGGGRGGERIGETRCVCLHCLCLNLLCHLTDKLIHMQAWVVQDASSPPHKTLPQPLEIRKRKCNLAESATLSSVLLSATFRLLYSVFYSLPHFLLFTPVFWLFPVYSEAHMHIFLIPPSSFLSLQKKNSPSLSSWPLYTHKQCKRKSLQTLCSSARPCPTGLPPVSRRTWTSVTSSLSWEPPSWCTPLPLLLIGKVSMYLDKSCFSFFTFPSTFPFEILPPPSFTV